MPLPPLPENNTDRAWLKYTSLGVEHEMVFRFPASTPQADIATACGVVANALKAYISTTDSFSGIRHQDAGSIVSFPISFTPVAGTGTGLDDGDDKPRYMSITGRSLQGYRVKLTQFTGQVTDATGYRQARLAGNYADVFLDAIEAMAVQPRAIDGNLVVWNQYANMGYNAYWQRKQRG